MFNLKIKIYNYIIVLSIKESLKMESLFNKDYKKQWRIDNKEHLKIYQKEYLGKKNNDVFCNVCDGCFKRYNKNIHERSKKHKMIVEMENHKIIINEMNAKIQQLESQARFY